MKVCVPVTADGQVGGGFGRAERVALASVDDQVVTEYELRDVHWDVLHDEDGEGRHHARIARFLVENHVELVVASHMGEPMRQMLDRLGVSVRRGRQATRRAPSSPRRGNPAELH